MTSEVYDRLILLNRMICRSVTRSRGVEPPALQAESLLKFIEARVVENEATEFDGKSSDFDDDGAVEPNAPFVRLRSIRFFDKDSGRYAALLIEHGDSRDRSIQFIRAESTDAREVEGEEGEYGGATTHVLIRLPMGDQHDDGLYRCAIEAVPPITRAMIGKFLNRQLRRIARAQKLEFIPTEERSKKGGRKSPLKYHPKFEFVTDVGRGLTLGGNELTALVFTKRAERHEFAEAGDVVHEEVMADAKIHINAKQAPKEPGEKRGWIESLINWYTRHGYRSRLYFKGVNGKETGSSVHKDVASAVDLLMCHKERIILDYNRKRWIGEECHSTINQMQEFLSRDDLWVQSKG